MAKISLRVKGKAKKDDDVSQHEGVRLVDWVDDDKVIGKIPKAKMKQLLNSEQDSQQQTPMQYPHEYVEKMHISKTNWLSRMERGGRR